MASSIVESVQGIDYNCRRCYLLPRESRPAQSYTLSHFPNSFDSAIQTASADIKGRTTERDQQLKRNKKGKNTDHGYSSTKLRSQADLKKTSE